MKSIGYDPTSKTLEVEYKDGKVATIKGVTEQEHADLMESQNMTAYFHKTFVAGRTPRCKGSV